MCIRDRHLSHTHSGTQVRALACARRRKSLRLTHRTPPRGASLVGAAPTALAVVPRGRGNGGLQVG
eukprot:1566577-Alexandrium_andersonii.AAC.1